MTGHQYNRSVDVVSMPTRMRRLPISPNGWPVPWFVEWFKDGKPCERGEGEPDFRVVDPRKINKALKQHLCWVCGELMGVNKCFVIGPMCAVNRVISEPPSHRDCAIYAARVCPFLSKPKMSRNDKDLYAGDGELRPGLVGASGIHIARNPGAACVWITRTFQPFTPSGGGVLFSLGRPTETLWFVEGRRATRKEVLASINSGFPILKDMAQQEGPEAVAALQAMLQGALALVPAD